MTPDERMLTLADLLDANAANEKGAKFDLSDWGSNASGNIFPIDCGTTVCAIGLGCLSPVLQKEGLKYETSGIRFFPRFDGRGGIGAINIFFGLRGMEFDDLFQPECAQRRGDPTKGADAERRVAQRIRKFVAARRQAFSLAKRRITTYV